MKNAKQQQHERRRQKAATFYVSVKSIAFEKFSSQ